MGNRPDYIYSVDGSDAARQRTEQAYYNNMQLDLELTQSMQEKIILSLEKINDTFEKSVQEMYNKNMLELESYMQAMDIMLNYKSIS